MFLLYDMNSIFALSVTLVKFIARFLGISDCLNDPESSYEKFRATEIVNIYIVLGWSESASHNC